MKTIIKNTFLIFLLLGASNTFAQIINGRVITAENTPLELANVIINGTTLNTTTDANGDFSIDSAGKLPFTLLIKYTGYKTERVAITTLPLTPLSIILSEDNQLAEVVISSRRRIEKAQNVPIPISVVSGKQAEQAGAFNVNRIKELIPSVQLYSSNPRNTGINIRSLGSPFGLTNDGIDPGVGFYVDGVYHARPAATSTDFLDIEQIEVDGTQNWLGFTSQDPDVQAGRVRPFSDGFSAIRTSRGVYFEGHTVKVIAYDRAGNAVTSDEVRVYVRHKKEETKP